MAMARHLLQNPGIEHGPIRICFTPDEEIGRGVHANLPGDLKADVRLYAWMGQRKGEIVYETFSADKATVKVKGYRSTLDKPKTNWSMHSIWPPRSSIPCHTSP